MEDAYNFLRLRGLTANHGTAKVPPVYDDSLAPRSFSGGEYPTNDHLNVTADRKEAIELRHHIVNGNQQRVLEAHEISDSKTTANGYRDRGQDPSQPRLLVWSAADERGATRLTNSYQKYFLEASPECFEGNSYLKSLVYTLACRRSSLPWKSFALVNSVSGLRNLKGLISRPARSSEQLGIGFIFTGQGAQYSGMGIDLLPYPIFENTLRSFDVALRDLGCEWSVFGTFLLS